MQGHKPSSLELYEKKTALFLDQKGNPRPTIPLRELEGLIRLGGNELKVLSEPINNVGGFGIEIPHVGILSEINGERSLYIPDMGKYTAIVYEIDFLNGVLDHAMGMLSPGASGCE